MKNENQYYLTQRFGREIVCTDNPTDLNTVLDAYNEFPEDEKPYLKIVKEKPVNSISESEFCRKHGLLNTKL